MSFMWMAKKLVGLMKNKMNLNFMFLFTDTTEKKLHIDMYESWDKLHLEKTHSTEKILSIHRDIVYREQIGSHS